MREAVLAIERGDGPFGHRAQQQRLHLGPRTVDLVEEEGAEPLAVPQQRAGLDARPAIGVDVGVIDQVAGHHVHGALDALELAADRAREGAQQRGLADAYVAFQQHVSPREQGHVDHADRLLLADDRLADLVFDSQRQTAPVLR